MEADTSPCAGGGGGVLAVEGGAEVGRGDVRLEGSAGAGAERRRGRDRGDHHLIVIAEIKRGLGWVGPAIVDLGLPGHCALGFVSGEGSNREADMRGSVARGGHAP